MGNILHNIDSKTRKPRRRIVRPVRPLSQFKVGQAVTVEGDYNGDYHGTVVKTHNHLSLLTSSYSDDHVTAPGVTVKVTRWEGVDYNGPKGSAFAPFEICAHDNIVTLHWCRGLRCPGGGQAG